MRASGGAGRRARRRRGALDAVFCDFHQGAGDGGDRRRASGGARRRRRARAPRATAMISRAPPLYAAAGSGRYGAEGRLPASRKRSSNAASGFAERDAPERPGARRRRHRSSPSRVMRAAVGHAIARARALTLRRRHSRRRDRELREPRRTRAAPASAHCRWLVGAAAARERCARRARRQSTATGARRRRQASSSSIRRGGRTSRTSGGGVGEGGSCREPPASRRRLETYARLLGRAELGAQPQASRRAARTRFVGNARRTATPFDLVTSTGCSG